MSACRRSSRIRTDRTRRRTGARSLSRTPPSSGTGPRAGVGPRAAACIPNPQGTFSGTATYDDGFTTLNYSWSGTVDFDPNGQINPWFPDYYTEVWDHADVA